MITFSPIQKLIQETLFKKMKMLDKTPPIEINEPSSDDGGGPQQNYMFARSVFFTDDIFINARTKTYCTYGW